MRRFCLVMVPKFLLLQFSDVKLAVFTVIIRPNSDFNFLILLFLKFDYL